MEDIRIKVYGLFKVNKKQFWYIYIGFSLFFIFMTTYFYFVDATVYESMSKPVRLIVENFSLFWLIMLLWLIIEGQFYWNKFSKRQLEIIKEQNTKLEIQKEEILSQKEEIETQKEEIQSQIELVTEQRDTIAIHKKEIVDSINYAYRIQHAILPPDYYVKKCLPDNFIYYRPKDIVSGDFYYVEEIDNFVVFAAVDCTGHGVPGAMMSVVGYNLLTQAIKLNKITEPAKILSFLDEGVSDTLRQTFGESGVNDGMDLAVCTLNKETLELQYAGAYNPLNYISKGQLYQIKADKFPIGVNYEGIVDEYTNHKVQLEKGDMIYIYSDGYADQFGGENGRKFMYKKLRELLLQISPKQMDEQYSVLENTFSEWKKDCEQIDDVLVMGIRV